MVRRKVESFGSTLAKAVIVDDNLESVSGAINDMRAQKMDLIICTGGMSVDPDDLTPGAIKAAGAKIVRYGTPVFPGAMFLVAYLDDKPVLGLPGCVMFERRTIFDVLLPRLAAGFKIRSAEIESLGPGGLCLNCPERDFPACGFGKGPEYWPMED
ncbi:MAG: hypothetical protein LBS60_06130 [Deltaproteobacteria bacterium]|nr:hypothetical protein [Deltaproteobacteria bacterium]